MSFIVENQNIDKTYYQTVQRLMLSKGAKWTIFYHITVILQYCWVKTIARSGDMYRDDLGIVSLVIKCFGITNTSVQNFAIRISSFKTVPKCLLKLKVFFNKFNIDVSSLLMSPLRSIFICQKYFGNHVKSSQIHLFAPLLNMRRCTLWLSWKTKCLNEKLALKDDMYVKVHITTYPALFQRIIHYQIIVIIQNFEQMI